MDLTVSGHGYSPLDWCMLNPSSASSGTFMRTMVGDRAGYVAHSSELKMVFLVSVSGSGLCMQAKSSGAEGVLQADPS